MTARPISILVICGTPDDRPETAVLKSAVDQLAEIEDVTISTWFLRKAPSDVVWDGAKVVDQLRLWRPAMLASHFGFDSVADRLRGLRLRWWLHTVAPDVVILDDGFGDRVIEHLRRTPLRVIKVNSTAPPTAGLEPTGNDADIYLLAGGAPLPSNTSRISPSAEILALPAAEWPIATSGNEASDPLLRFPKSRDATRRSLGLPANEPLIVGWGDDGWLDGPDLFVRALWALEARHGVVAHGLWIGLTSDANEVRRLEVEATRCGLAGRFHHRPTADFNNRLCADVAFLPYRSDADDNAIFATIGAGMVVVTTPATSVEDPAVRVVDHLDVEKAATELSAALEFGRQHAIDDFDERGGVWPTEWVAHAFLPLVIRQLALRAT